MTFFVKYCRGCDQIKILEIIYMQVQRWCPMSLQLAVKFFSNTRGNIFSFTKTKCTISLLRASKKSASNVSHFYDCCMGHYWCIPLYMELIKIWLKCTQMTQKTKVRYLQWWTLLCNMHFVEYVYCIALCDIEQSQFTCNTCFSNIIFFFFLIYLYIECIYIYISVLS